MITTFEELLEQIDDALAEVLYAARLHPRPQQEQAALTTLEEHPLQEVLAEVALTRPDLLAAWAWNEDTGETLPEVQTALRDRARGLVAEL